MIQSNTEVSVEEDSDRGQGLGSFTDLFVIFLLRGPTGEHWILSL